MNNKSFYIKEDDKPVIINVTDITEYIDLYKDILPENYITKQWWYFNRLNVPERLRGKGFSKELITKLCEWANVNNIAIFNEITPYGVDLSLNKLITLYAKFGFYNIKGNRTLMIRLPVIK